MTLVNVKPGRKVNQTKSIFDNFFDDFFQNEFSQAPVRRTGTKRPAVNIVETGEGFRIDLAVPGLNKKDFVIDLDKDVLTIESNYEAKTVEGEKFLRREFNYGQFKRTFRIPETIDTTSIKAMFNNGILSVTLAKKEEAKEQAPRSIKIS